MDEPGNGRYVDPGQRSAGRGYGRIRKCLAARLKLTDLDRYVEEHGVSEADYPAAFALWIAERTGGPVSRFEKVEGEAPADGIVIEGDDL